MGNEPKERGNEEQTTELRSDLQGRSPWRRSKVTRRWPSGGAIQCPPTQITEWKQQLLARAADVFGGAKAPSETPDLKPFMRRSGNWRWRMICEGALIKGGLLSAKRRSIARTLASRAAMPTPEAGPLDRLASRRRSPETTLALMRRIDELHCTVRFAGARMLRDLLAAGGPCHWTAPGGHAHAPDGD
ncbi:MAG: hypothetical protein IPM58_16365 [Nitrospira sp.]|nr:hypothetical protein [Nitrospira sp.]